MVEELALVRVSMSPPVVYRNGTLEDLTRLKFVEGLPETMRGMEFSVLGIGHELWFALRSNVIIAVTVLGMLDQNSFKIMFLEVAQPRKNQGVGSGSLVELSRSRILCYTAWRNRRILQTVGVQEGRHVGDAAFKTISRFGHSTALKYRDGRPRSDPFHALTIQGLRLSTYRRRKGIVGGICILRADSMRLEFPPQGFSSQSVPLGWGSEQLAARLAYTDAAD